jgi:hypothetical protein
LTGARFRLTPQQSRMQFSMWAVLTAPLLLGTRPSRMSSWDLKTYTNPLVIAVNQDPMGVQGVLIQSDCPPLHQGQGGPLSIEKVPSCAQVWARPLSDASFALCLVNFGKGPNTHTHTHIRTHTHTQFRVVYGQLRRRTQECVKKIKKQVPRMLPAIPSV